MVNYVSEKDKRTREGQGVKDKGSALELGQFSLNGLNLFS